MTLTSLILLLTVILFALVHLFGGKMTFLSKTPRSIWLSGSGGVAVAYVFVHLLPELAEHQETIGEQAPGSGFLGSLESHAYGIALFGLVLFYGIERLAGTVARDSRGSDETVPLGVFWIHLGAFALYNVLIGYLLVHRDEQDLRGLIVYAVAMSLHFVVNDQGLRDQHGETYHRRGRWLLAFAPVLGLLLGLATQISDLVLSALFAFLAGGVILNILKEELPRERQSRFYAFAGGAVLYAGLLLAS